MNRNFRHSLWVLALGITFTGLGATSLGAAVPAHQDQDQHRYQDQDRNDNQRGARWSFQQGLQDGRHDRQYGGNRNEHQQPRDSNDLNAYRDGYKHGYRNIPTSQQEYPTRVMNYFDQGFQDGRHDRQYGGNRSEHQQPRGSNDNSAYRDGYKHGYRNIPTN